MYSPLILFLIPNSRFLANNGIVFTGVIADDEHEEETSRTHLCVLEGEEPKVFSIDDNDIDFHPYVEGTSHDQNSVVSYDPGTKDTTKPARINASIVTTNSKSKATTSVTVGAYKGYAAIYQTPEGKSLAWREKKPSEAYSICKISETYSVVGNRNGIAYIWKFSEALDELTKESCRIGTLLGHDSSIATHILNYGRWHACVFGHSFCKPDCYEPADSDTSNPKANLDSEAFIYYTERENLVDLRTLLIDNYKKYLTTAWQLMLREDAFSQHNFVPSNFDSGNIENKLLKTLSNIYDNKAKKTKYLVASLKYLEKHQILEVLGIDPKSRKLLCKVKDPDSSTESVAIIDTQIQLENHVREMEPFDLLKIPDKC